jgi:hypothetical protein
MSDDLSEQYFKNNEKYIQKGVSRHMDSMG